jgi:hypothetical protein
MHAKRRNECPRQGMGLAEGQKPQGGHRTWFDREVVQAHSSSGWVGNLAEMHYNGVCPYEFVFGISLAEQRPETEASEFEEEHDDQKGPNVLQILALWVSQKPAFL